MGTNIITPKFIERMRSSDYQNTSYAFAELIDNSFDAQATEVKVICIEKRDKHNKRFIDEVIFSDNGIGMSYQTLNNCLTFAFGTNEDLDTTVTNKKIGKFGMGLPNSSISQCKDVMVYSKPVNGDWTKKSLNIKRLLETNSTELDDAVISDIPAHYKDINAVFDDDKGTIVSWKECDRLDRQYADTLYNRSEGTLGRLFRYYISNGCKISLQTTLYNAEDNSYIEQSFRYVVLNDPLFLIPNAFITKALREEAKRDESISEAKNDPATYYQKFIAGLDQNESLPTSKKFEDQSYKYSFEWSGKEYAFRIKTSHALLDIQKPGIREGGKTKVGAVYGEKMKSGNIYFTRHQREIACGHYGFYNLSSENNRWWSIEIDFDADADDLIGVSNTKQGIKFTRTVDDESSMSFDKHTASLQQAREKLWFDLSNKITKAIQAVSSVLSDQAKQFDIAVSQDEDDDITVPTGTQATTKAIKRTDKQREGRFDPEQKEDLKEVLSAKFLNLEEAEIQLAIEKFDKSLVRGCVVYCPILDNPQLWSFSEVRGFLIIYINTSHEFYNNIIAPFREMEFDAALTAIELFISSLAWEQNEHFNNDPEKRRNLDNFRTYVGMHLNSYLQENDIKIDPESIIGFEDANTL